MGDIRITPNRGNADDPNIEFIGNSGVSGSGIYLNVLEDGSLSFEGTAGQLFSITDSLTGTIFSVNDIAGIPSIEVDDDGTIRLAEFTGNVLVGTDTDDGSSRLQVNGNIAVSGTVDGRNVSADGSKLDGIESNATADQTASEILNAIKTVDGTGSALDADLLDGNHASAFYLATNPNGYTSNAGTVTSVVAGGGLSGGTITSAGTISHADTSAQTSVNNSNGTVIQDVFLDTYGHITGLGSVNLDGRYLTGFTETNLFLGDGGNGNTHPGSSRIIYAGQLNNGSPVLGMPAVNNSNSILNINRHPGEYNSQLGFSSNGNMYYRSFSNVAINSTEPWRKIWDSANDGAGSALDADLLDGNHASAFYLATNPSGYSTSSELNATNDTSTTVLYPVMVAAAGSNQTPKVTTSATALAYDPSIRKLQVGSLETDSSVYVGSGNTSSGTFSTSVGAFNQSTGFASSAFGASNTASGGNSSAVGYANVASGENSSAFGYFNTATALNSVAIGRRNRTLSTAYTSVSVGILNNTSGATITSSNGAISGTIVDNSSQARISSAVGIKNLANGIRSSAFGYGNTASAYRSSSIGYQNTASAYYSSAFGYSNEASAFASSAFGYKNTASGSGSSAFGYSNTASGNYSYAFGRDNDVSGSYASAIGYRVKVTVSDVQELGYWSSTTVRGAAVRIHGNDGYVAISLENQASAYIDGGATAGSELDGRLMREAYALRRDGTDLYVDFNVGGLIYTKPVGSHPNISAESSVNNSGNTVIQDITLDSNGHITGINSATISSVSTATNATNATNVSLTSTSDTTAYVVLAETASTSNQRLRYDADLKFNASAGKMAINYSGSTPSAGIHLKQNSNDGYGGYRLERSDATNNWTAAIDSSNRYAFYYATSSTGGGAVQAQILTDGTYIDNPSDMRLKTNISKITNPIDKVKKLEGFTFNYNSLGQEIYELDTEKKYIGVSAQSVLENLPEAAGIFSKVDDTDYFYVKYEKIVPLLIEAIKEQQKQIDELKALLQNNT